MNAPAPDVEAVEKSEPKARLTPKMTLRGMVAYVMDLRAKCRMRTITGPDGVTRLRTDDEPFEWADRAFVELTPEDAEKLDDIAEALDWLYMQQIKNQSGGGRRR